MFRTPTKRQRARTVNSTIAPKVHRVSRACDNCRLRKSKCNGKLPCTFCIIQHFECTYDTSRPKPKLSTKYIIKLEKDIERLKAALGIFKDAELTDDILSEAINSRNAVHPPIDTTSGEGEHSESPTSPGSTQSASHALLETMIEATGQLSIDERGNCDYYANTAGLALIERIRERCDALLEGRADDPPLHATESFQPLASVKSSSISEANKARPCLPPKDLAAELIALAFNCALPLFNFIHQPSFYSQFDQFYAERYNIVTASSLGDVRFEALLYELFALGELFTSEVSSNSAAKAATRAEAFFLRGTKLIDITNCRDLISLQALVCMVVYLQCCAAIPTAYTYISLATTACTRMGIHQSESIRRLNPIDRETRKRLFWALRTMDVCVTSLLGLPRTLSDDDVDQELPLAVDDKYITADCIGTCDCHSTCPMTAANAHTRLILIMAKVKKNVLGWRKSSCQTEAYKVDYSRIVQVENELDAWFSSLPGDFSFSTPASDDVMKAQLLLRLMHAHVQMVLYRPFLHHITKRKTDPDFDMRAFAYASACVEAAQQVIWLNEALDSKGLLHGSYWFILYTTFIAVLSLLMFVLSNKTDPTAQECLSAAVRGYLIFIKFVNTTVTAGKFLESLKPLFARLSKKKLNGVPILQFSEDTSDNQLDANATLFPPVVNVATEMSIGDFRILSPLPKTQSFTTSPDIPMDLEQHLQAMVDPCGDTLQYLSGDVSMMDCYFPFNAQSSFSDIDTAGFFPSFETVDQQG